MWVLGPPCAALVLLVASCSWPPSRSPEVSAEPRNRIESIRHVPAGVEIALRSDRAFPVRNELAILSIGSRDFYLSRYPDDGDTHVLIFFLTNAEYDQVREGDEVTVRYGQGAPAEWRFGRLDKKPGNRA